MGRISSWTPAVRVSALVCLLFPFTALTACGPPYDEDICDPFGCGPAEDRTRVSKIKIGMTRFEVFETTGPWPGADVREDGPTPSCENFTYLTDDGGRNTQVAYDGNGRVERVDHDQKTLCGVY